MGEEGFPRNRRSKRTVGKVSGYCFSSGRLWERELNGIWSSAGLSLNGNFLPGPPRSEEPRAVRGDHGEQVRVLVCAARHLTVPYLGLVLSDAGEGGPEAILESRDVSRWLDDDTCRQRMDGKMRI